MVRFLVGLVAITACGEVSKKSVDAGADVSVPDDGISDAAGPQVVTAVSAHGVSAFGALNAQFTKVPYNAEVYDDEGEFDPTTARFTAKASGDYLVCAGLAVNETGYEYELDVYLNNTRLRALANGEDVARGCTVVRMAANDFLEIWMYHLKGGTVNVTQNLVWDWLTIGRLPAASVAAATQADFTADNQTPTRIPYTNEQRDELTAYDGTSSTFTAPSAGDYFSCGSITVGASFFSELGTVKNGAAVVRFGRGISASNGCRTTRLAANDTLTHTMLQANGGTRTIPHNTFWNWLSIYNVPALLQVDNVSAFTMSQGQFSKVLYTGESFDTGGQFDVGTNTFTAAAAGDYLVCAGLAPEAVLYVTEIDIFKDGAQLMGLGHGRVHHTGCHIVRLAQGNQIDIRAYQGGSSSPISVAANPVWNWLQISKLK